MLYHRLATFLCKRNSRNIPSVRSSRVYRFTPNKIIVEYHNTAVLIADWDGYVELHSGGWKTVTTKRRMNEYLEHWRVWQKNHEWFVSRDNVTLPFVEGMKVFDVRAVAETAINYAVGREKIYGALQGEGK